MPLFILILKRGILMKKIMICILLLFSFTLEPIYANTSKTFLITSEQMPYYFIVTLKKEEILTKILPKNTILPIACAANKPYPLTTLNVKQSACTIDSIYQSYQIPIDYYLFLNDQAFQDEFQISFDQNTIPALLKEGTKVKEQLKLSHILTYSHYISTDISALDLLQLFQSFPDQQQLSYYYGTFLKTKRGNLPLTTSFTKH